LTCRLAQGKELEKYKMIQLGYGNLFIRSGIENSILKISFLVIIARNKIFTHNFENSQSGLLSP
jgi:hypothetical protein